MAMGQNPNRTPSEHPNPTTKIGSLKWVVNSPTNQKGIGFDNHSDIPSHTFHFLSGRGSSLSMGHSPNSKASLTASPLPSDQVGKPLHDQIISNGCGSTKMQPKWNPAKWTHGLKSAVPWYNFDPYPPNQIISNPFGKPRQVKVADSADGAMPCD